MELKRPMEQGEQKEEPVEEPVRELAVPARQAEQEDRPGEEVIVPEPQGSHWTAPL